MYTVTPTLPMPCDDGGDSDDEYTNLYLCNLCFPALSIHIFLTFSLSLPSRCSLYPYCNHHHQHLNKSSPVNIMSAVRREWQCCGPVGMNGWPYQLCRRPSNRTSVPRRMLTLLAVLLRVVPVKTSSKRAEPHWPALSALWATMACGDNDDKDEYTNLYPSLCFPALSIHIFHI